jgi:hypothetical protein
MLVAISFWARPAIADHRGENENAFFSPFNEASGRMGCGKAAPWKSPQNGLSHLAWKSAKPADSHFSTATTAADVFYLGSKRTEKPKPISSEINLLQLKNGLDFGVHHTSRRNLSLISIEILP